jgi:hypothetical protein
MGFSDRLYKEIKRFTSDEEGDIIGTLLDFVLLITLILILVAVVPILTGRSPYIDNAKEDWDSFWNNTADWWVRLWGGNPKPTKVPESTENTNKDIDSFVVALSALNEGQPLVFSSNNTTYVARSQGYKSIENGFRSRIDFYTVDEWTNYTAGHKNEQDSASNPVAFSKEVGTLLEKQEGWAYVTSDKKMSLTASGLNPETERGEKGFLSATLTLYAQILRGAE